MKLRLIISFFSTIYIYTVYVVYIKHICICTYFSHVLALGRDVETIDSRGVILIDASGPQGDPSSGAYGYQRLVRRAPSRLSRKRDAQKTWIQSAQCRFHVKIASTEKV